MLSSRLRELNSVNPLPRFLRGTVLIWLALTYCGTAQTVNKAGRPQVADSKWKTFVSKAGWAVHYPSTWDVSSCNQCPDPTDPNVFVSFYDPSTREVIMIERLKNAPQGQSQEQWLREVAAATNLNPSVSEDWISLVGASRALRVVNRNSDSTESENIYVLYGSKTIAIRFGKDGPSYSLFTRMLSTLRLSTR